MTQKNISIDRIDKQKDSLVSIYDKFFANLQKINYTWNLVICFPFWEINQKHIYFNEIYEILENYCDIQVLFPENPRQRLACPPTQVRQTPPPRWQPRLPTAWRGKTKCALPQLSDTCGTNLCHFRFLSWLWLHCWFEASIPSRVVSIPTKRYEPNGVSFEVGGWRYLSRK